MGSSPHAPPDAIPQLGQVPENASEEPSRLGVEETGYVFPNEPCRTKYAKRTLNLWPEVTVVTRRLTLACNAVRLARKSAGYEVNGAGDGIQGEFAHVPDDRDSGPSLCEDSLAVGVSLHKGDCFKASPFRGQIQPADAREEGEVFHPLEPK
jgi:hypothetical protein